MRHLCLRILTCALILMLFAGQTAAFELKMGPMNIWASPVGIAGHYTQDNTGLGAMLSVPLGFADAESTSVTLNGQDINQFTQQDAKDSLIVIMLVVATIAAGALSVGAASN